MSQSSLTTKYRPQRFDEVAGQQTVKSILSRASAEDHIAPAYLFSGTRGVGKTTLARIMAKAVNCEKAPTGEPCNECAHCRQITQGTAVDVIEMDGASNRGIDDARRLKEDVGYAPMECRYKVFIIDEAHMLTKEAFNALLKTLEEPPGRVTFIMATTEPDKFPATIISRCQHYVFKRLPASEIEAHLADILKREKVEYEEKALALLAKRAAGSVRDSMSLLGQVLALGGERVLEADVRSILGLAGQDVFFGFMEALRDQNPLAVAGLLREILDQGLDLGFFLRELGTVWRNLFLLKQSGEQAIPILEMPEEEARTWLDWAEQLDAAHIHACWQMTLEGQRRVRESLEPALALELLLLNMALLPQLLPLEKLGPAGQGPAPGQGGQTGAPPRPAPAGRGGPAPAQGGNYGQRAQGAPAPSSTPFSAPRQTPEPYRRPQPESSPVAPAAPPVQGGGPLQGSEQGSPQESRDVVPDGPKNWRGFEDYTRRAAAQDGFQRPQLWKQVEGEYQDGCLRVHCKFAYAREQLEGQQYKQWFTRRVRAYFGPDTRLEVTSEKSQLQTTAASKEEAEKHPLVQQIKKELGASLLPNSMGGR